MNKKSKKGFTLVELIVVIAIIGVLIAVIVPSYMSWIAHSKIRKQNNNARIIFNAAQTIVQEYRFKERTLDAADRSIGNGEFYFYWDKDTGASTAGSTGAKSGDADFINSFSSQVNKLCGGDATNNKTYVNRDTTYRVYVDNYMVKSVVASSDNNNRNKGSYPTKQENANTTPVNAFDMTTVVLP